MTQIWGIQVLRPSRQLTFYLPECLPIPRFTLGSRVVCRDTTLEGQEVYLAGMVIDLGYYTPLTARRYGRESFWEYVLELDQPSDEILGDPCYEHITREEFLYPELFPKSEQSNWFFGLIGRIMGLFDGDKGLFR